MIILDLLAALPLVLVFGWLIFTCFDKRGRGR